MSPLKLMLLDIALQIAFLSIAIACLWKCFGGWGAIGLFSLATAMLHAKKK